jgi:hypothetical protein
MDLISARLSATALFTRDRRTRHRARVAPERRASARDRRRATIAADRAGFDARRARRLAIAPIDARVADARAARPRPRVARGDGETRSRPSTDRSIRALYFQDPSDRPSPSPSPTPSND